MSKINRNDWRTQLAELSKEMKENMSEEERQTRHLKPHSFRHTLNTLMREKGVNPEDMAWETLGCDTQKFREVFNKNRDGHYIPEITSAYEWQIQKRLADPRHQNNTVILGCHDHGPFAQVCDDNFYAQKNCPNGIYEEAYIVGSLYPEKTNDERSKIMEQLKWDRRLRVKLKFEEMFRFAQKIQLTFMDFFGLDKTYNNAGTQNPNNWKLRMKKNYQECQK